MEARANLQDIYSYIDVLKPGAANRLARRLVSTAESLCAASERGRLVAPGVRQIAAIRPYLIRYTVTPDTVTIVGIRHAARAE